MKVIVVSNYFIFHQSTLWDEIYKHEDINLTFIATADDLDEERKNMGYTEADRPYLKRSSSFSDEELKEYFKDVDIVVIGLNLDKRIDALIVNVPNLIVLTEHISKHPTKIGNIIGLFKWFNIEKHYYTKGNKYLLALSSHAYGDFKNRGFKGHGYQFGYFPELKHIKAKKDPFSIIWFGRIIKLKRIEYALHALAYLKTKDPRYHLTIIGEGDDLERIKRIASDYGVTDSVVYKGFMSHENIMKELSKASIEIFSSNNYEGWGVMLNEGLVSGCICFASVDPGSSKFLIEDNKNGFLYDGYNSLEKKIDLFTSLNDKQVEEMRENAIKTIAEEWNVKVASDRLYELLINIYNHKDFDKYQSGPVKKIK